MLVNPIARDGNHSQISLGSYSVIFQKCFSSGNQDVWIERAQVSRDRKKSLSRFSSVRNHSILVHIIGERLTPHLRGQCPLANNIQLSYWTGFILIIGYISWACIWEGIRKGVLSMRRAKILWGSPWWDLSLQHLPKT